MSTFPRYILAPYVATPADVVERMIALADVQANDRVYDLGCGDGRIAIAAAVARGARGLGVDIEPYWIEQSQLNATAAGVSELLQFMQTDVFDLDLSPASVVFLYLVQWSTQRVCTSILAQCAPGTRVVSHSFPFEAEATIKSERFIDATGEPRSIHLWIVPGGT